MQRPRISAVPPCASSTGDEAVELAAVGGIILDPWQEFVLRQSLGERADGKWAAFEVGLVTPRQNGKDEILLARELVGMFLLAEPLIVHSAHEFATSLEHFRRLVAVIEDTPAFHRRLKPRGIKNSHGEEGIELKGGQRIRFKARTKGAGRGFTGDLLIINEAMFAPERTLGAILPTLSARSISGNPQVWYAGSAVDQYVTDDGIVLARVRERGIAGDDPALAYFEWSVDADNPETVADPTADWEIANPGLGIRISREHVEREQRSLDARTFAVERLGVGDWPRTDGLEETVIDPEKWTAGADAKSKILDPVCIAFDVSPDRSSSSIGGAGLRADGLRGVEVIEPKAGTGWVANRIFQLAAAHKPHAVICDGGGAAGGLIADVNEVLKPLGIEVEVVSAKEHAQACGMFFDGFDQGTIRHLDQPELNAAIVGAAQRPLGEAWAWSRKNSSVDITPLVATTLALWGTKSLEAAPEPFIEVF